MLTHFFQSILVYVQGGYFIYVAIIYYVSSFSD